MHVRVKKVRHSHFHSQPANIYIMMRMRMRMRMRMMIGGGWWSILLIVVISWSSSAASSSSSAQTNLLNEGCSLYNSTNPSQFYGNLNTTLADLRGQLKNNNVYFGTAQHGTVYAMVQCRNYLSQQDCIACFDVAAFHIRNCSAANGARVIYDGCFLRYESTSFYDQGTVIGNSGICGNRNVSDATIFGQVVQTLLSDLQVATPKINGFHAASKKQLVVVGGGAMVYGVAQCAETVTETACRDCLKVAYGNIHNCPPAADGRAFDAGCFLRYSDTSFFADNKTTNINPFLTKGNSTTKNIIIGGVAGGGVALLLLLIALFVWYRLSLSPKASRRGDILGATELQGPVNYKYNDLKSATNNFSETNKLGEGGFGDVYKGTLKNGKIVAVKKLIISQSSRARADFESEVKLISNVHHRNLIRLLGCCQKGSQLLLVYEYMANSSLDKFLFGERRGSLNWKQRYDIILGTAKGLSYLHEEFHVRIIHRDIKPGNILLDDDFHAKIADFGLARLLPQDQSHVSTKFAGTLGYTAPEYAIHGQLSEKVDVYSYGVVILEIISGQKSNEADTNSDSGYLLQRAWGLYEQGMQLDLVDKSLQADEYKEEDVMKIIEIALMCTQASASSRPTMSDVVVLLVSKGNLEHQPPTRPTFIDSSEKRPQPRGDTSTSTGSSTSNATASISLLSAR